MKREVKQIKQKLNRQNLILKLIIKTLYNRKPWGDTQ